MSKSSNRLRRQLSFEAARIMAEEGVNDYGKAKRKACSRVGVNSRHTVPTNLEIEDSLIDYLAVFSKEKLSAAQQQYLQEANSVMRILADYSPRLTGAALSGAITDSRPITIHAFAASFEEVSATLIDRDIYHKISEKRLRFLKIGYKHLPVLEFFQSDIVFVIFVFLPGQPYPPLSVINGKPIKWISRKRLGKILQEQQ